MPRVLLTVLLIGWCTALPVSAAIVVCDHLDGRQVDGVLTDMQGGIVTVRQDDRPLRLALDDLARISFQSDGWRQRPSARRHTLVYLAGGGQVHGRLDADADDAIVLKTGFAAPQQIGLAHCTAIRLDLANRSAALSEVFEQVRAAPPTGKDTLIAERDGQIRTLTGTLLAIGPQRGEFRFAGKTRSFRIETIYGVVLATTDADRPPPSAHLHLDDGDILPGRLVGCTDQTLTFDAPWGATIALPLERLRDVQLISPRVVHLGELTPASQSSRGLIHPGSPPRVDRNVWNEPLRLDGRTFATGLGVRAYTEMVYELDIPYETFAATIGIDDSVRPGGKVQFIVRVDGENVFDSGMITGRDPARDIQVPITGAGRLTLIVDFADNADIGDWADWAAARLIKPKQSS